MTADRAIEIAARQGAFESGFFGEVTFTVKDGGIKQVAVVQTFREEAATA